MQYPRNTDLESLLKHLNLFADRLEVWNPGTLPGTLTLDDLRHDHPSVPHNPLIAESLYLTRYIEKAGSGTQRMIELCGDTGLPAPDFELRQGFFVNSDTSRSFEKPKSGRIGRQSPGRRGHEGVQNQVNHNRLTSRG